MNKPTDVVVVIRQVHSMHLKLAQQLRVKLSFLSVLNVCTGGKRKWLHSRSEESMQFRGILGTSCNSLSFSCSPSYF